MNIRSNIINDIQSFSPEMISEVFHLLESLKNKNEDKYNWHEYIGCISDDEAKSMMRIIDEEFNQIEGDW